MTAPVRPIAHTPMPAAALPRDRALLGRPATVAVAFGALVALGAAAVFQTPYVTPDSVFALSWGRELTEGTLTSFAPGPTPHPLTVAAAALTAPLGIQGSYDATYVLFGPVALGALVAAVFSVGRRIGSLATGALAALVVLSSAPILVMSAAARYDVAFAALVMTALAVELARPGRAVAVLAILAVAGLIRPEAWPVAGLYWLWLFPRMQPRQRVLTAGIVLAAPLGWASMDAAVTGDPLWSFHHTEAQSRGLYGRYTWSENLLEGGRNMLAYVSLFAIPVAALAALRRMGTRTPATALVWALLAVSVGIFLALVASGSASSERYLVLPACLVAVLAAAAATAWRATATWLVVAAFTLLALQTLGRANAAIHVRDDLRPAIERMDQLEQLARMPEVRTMLLTCPVAALPFAYVERWAYFSGRDIGSWTLDERGRSRPDVYVAPATPSAAKALLTRRRFDDDARFTVPPGLRRGPGTRDWQLWVADSSPCVGNALRGGSAA